MPASFHSQFLMLVDQIERKFPVTRWKCGDVDIWPLARMDLYLDMHSYHTGGNPRHLRTLPLRVLSNVARPLINLWRSRRDLAHCILFPKPADAIFLGDGISLDRVHIDGAWRDRFSEPIMAALEKRGRRSFLMQSGDLSRLPWHRPTFAANMVEAWGWLTCLTVKIPVALPDHERVLEFLAANKVSAPAFARDALVRRARAVSATASAFEYVLKIVKPKLAFVVTYYAGLGPAFVLACRRLGILAIDLQHCPQDGTHKAYGWSALPENGFTTLPALFWNWTERDAANIQRWASTLSLPWHRSVHGGNVQLAPFLDDGNPDTMAWQKKFDILCKDTEFEREILVALQPISGHRSDWDALADQIENAPPQWRWWIRRHPSSRRYQDAEFGRLLRLQKTNVVIDPASFYPLPALLRNMNVLLSLASGSTAEAAFFGVPALFLSDEAYGPFAELIAQGQARVINVATVNVEIARLPTTRTSRAPIHQPESDATLLQLEAIAEAYAELCRSGRG